MNYESHYVAQYFIVYDDNEAVIKSFTFATVDEVFAFEDHLNNLVDITFCKLDEYWFVIGPMPKDEYPP